MLSRLLFWLSRNDVTDPVVRWVFGHASWLLPVRRVASTPTVLAFHHPRPSYDTHILLVPKVGIASLMALTPAHDLVVTDIFKRAAELSRSFTAGTGPTALIVNGGARQDVGQMHFHLIADNTEPSYACPNGARADRLLNAGSVLAFSHPVPVVATHVVLRPKSFSGVPNSSIELDQTVVRDVIAATQDLVQRLDLAGEGFSLVVGGRDGLLDLSCLHLLSSKSTPPP